jgi:predicted PhzF superfamily epimerase YddE/YHI9
MKAKIYQVDAFTDILFSGNPAAVCPLHGGWPDQLIMQNIAMENNLAGMAFIIHEGDDYLNNIKQIKARGIIITAGGKECDFVSRFFDPQSGIDEYPVTGSAHTILTAYWSKRLNKSELTARQLSRREGFLICRNKNERTEISGKARLYMAGEIDLSPLAY